MFGGGDETNKKKKEQKDWAEDINFYAVFKFESLPTFFECTKLTVVFFQYLYDNNN